MSERNISITGIGDFCVRVRYKRTNRHKTKIYMVDASPVGWEGLSVPIGEFHVLKNDQVNYNTWPNVHYLVSEKVKKEYPLEELQKLETKS